MSRPNVVLQEKHGFSRTFDPVQLGIPLAQGYLQDAQPHYLKYCDGELVTPFQTRPISYWPDNSVRWLHVSFPANLAPKQTRVVELFNEAPRDTHSISQVVPAIEPGNDDLSLRVTLPNGGFRDLEFELKDISNTPCSVRVEISRSRTVSELMETISKSDCVVATRFHATVLPLQLGIPVLGICYYRKAAELLTDVGLGDYYVNIDDFDGEGLLNKYNALSEHISSGSLKISEEHSRYIQSLDEQYRTIAALAVKGDQQ